MKFKISLLSLLFSGILCAQTKINLPDLNLAYELPKDWEFKSFYKYNWESPGGDNLCACAGVLNSFKISGGDYYDYVYIAVYPSEAKYVNTEKRQRLWDYEFIPVKKTDFIKTPFMDWERQISKLRATTNYDNRFKDFTAYRLHGQSGTTHYLMYIWAKPALLLKYKTEINNVIHTFKAIN